MAKRSPSAMSPSHPTAFSCWPPLSMARYACGTWPIRVFSRRTQATRMPNLHSRPLLPHGKVDLSQQASRTATRAGWIARRPMRWTQLSHPVWLLSAARTIACICGISRPRQSHRCCLGIVTRSSALQYVSQVEKKDWTLGRIVEWQHLLMLPSVYPHTHRHTSASPS